jgi:hypothetical protein
MFPKLKLLERVSLGTTLRHLDQCGDCTLLENYFRLFLQPHQRQNTCIKKEVSTLNVTTLINGWQRYMYILQNQSGYLILIPHMLNDSSVDIILEVLKMDLKK